MNFLENLLVSPSQSAFQISFINTNRRESFPAKIPSSTPVNAALVLLLSTRNLNHHHRHGSLRNAVIQGLPRRRRNGTGNKTWEANKTNWNEEALSPPQKFTPAPRRPFIVKERDSSTGNY